MKTLRLRSAHNMVCMPGMLRFARHEYDTGDAGGKLHSIKLTSKLMPSMPVGLALALLTGEQKFLVEDKGETLVIRVADDDQALYWPKEKGGGE